MAITGSSLPPVPRPKVHDAALRLRLLECAGATLSTRGLAALSLRTLAADVGTSTTAVYALFGGKPGLLAALHAEAFARLGARLDAVPLGADPVEDLVALGRGAAGAGRPGPAPLDRTSGDPPVGHRAQAQGVPAGRRAGLG